MDNVWDSCPALTAWNTLDKQVRKRGVPPTERPPKPAKNPAYPTKQKLGVPVLQSCREAFPTVALTCVLAETLYGPDDFLTKASKRVEVVQVISQLRSTQKIRWKANAMNLATYFTKCPGGPQHISIRGGQEDTVIVGSARLHVCAQGKKRFVIALKYEGEETSRDLAATD